MFRSLHSMKSTAGTLDLTALYEATCEVVELLRSGHYAQVPPYLEKLKTRYYKAVEAIQSA